MNCGRQKEGKQKEKQKAKLGTAGDKRKNKGPKKPYMSNYSTFCCRLFGFIFHFLLVFFFFIQKIFE